MSQQSLTAKIVKASANMKKLSEFFAARREWDFPPDVEPSISDLARAAAGVSEEIRTLMALCGANPAGERVPDVEDLGAGTHDPARLQRFMIFLRDLRIWFTAQSGPPTDSDGIAALREMDAHISGMIAILREALKRQAERRPEPPTVPKAEAAQAPEAPPPAPEAPVTPEFGKFPPQLVLDNTEANPMVQVFQGREELTPECEQLADAFLAAWDVELSYFSRKKLLERILRWILSAPDGQVLVIKMKTIEEPYEPYPSYVSREVLDGKNPSENS